MEAGWEEEEAMRRKSSTHPGGMGSGGGVAAEAQRGRGRGKGWGCEGLLVVSCRLNNIYLTDSRGLTSVLRGGRDTALGPPRCRGDDHLPL